MYVDAKMNVPEHQYADENEHNRSIAFERNYQNVHPLLAWDKLKTIWKQNQGYRKK